MCYLRRLDGIPKSDLLAVSYPLKNNKGSVQSAVASQNAPSTLSTVLVHTCKRSVSFQSNKFLTPYSRMSESNYSLIKIIGLKTFKSNPNIFSVNVKFTEYSEEP